ncbi:MAG TPA: lysine-sensitive aspartokinase 3 [Vicinamibacterales bacterium]|nr:lysine-sensitive aspartokinase 3 [Vicinamibacterales bacterium]
MKVMKFGGTSVADRGAIERLIAIVRAERQAEAQTEGGDARGPVVVVSALSGVTDRLLGVAALAGSGDVEGARTSLQDLRARHIKVSEVITDDTLRMPVVDALNKEFDDLERIVSALAVLQEVSPRWLDALAATGEILSSQIVAAALTSHKLLASWVDSRKAVVTDAEHTAAAPQFEETTAALMMHADPPLAAGRIPVMGGFVGATSNGVTTTLGRGGSDFSAAIVGACLGAAEIQIWTDVDGMLTADPRIVPNPQVVPHLSFAEASELAYFGAKVLHPATIQPAVARNIPVRILNSQRPTARGTLITGERPKTTPLTAVASKKAVTVVDITSTRMLMAHGFLRRLFEVFERFKTPVDVVTTSEVSVSVTIDDARRLPAIVEALSSFAQVEREDQMAIVCVVGDGLHDDPGLTARVLESVGDVPLRMLSQAASRRNITFVIREADLPLALGRVHDRFFAAVGA